jgi:hypothetical protein
MNLRLAKHCHFFFLSFSTQIWLTDAAKEVLHRLHLQSGQSSFDSLPPLTLPVNQKTIVADLAVMPLTTFDLLFAAFRAYADDKNNRISGFDDPIFGLDFKWQVNFGGAELAPSTAQLSTLSGQTFFIQFYAFINGILKSSLTKNATAGSNASGSSATSRIRLPNSLVKFFENASISKVGAFIKGDATRITRYYDVTIKGVLDVADYGLQTGYLASRTSLATLVGTFLERKLDKSGNLLFTRWEEEDVLPKTSIQYGVDFSMHTHQCFFWISLRRTSLI